MRSFRCVELHLVGNGGSSPSAEHVSAQHVEQSCGRVAHSAEGICTTGSTADISEPRHQSSARTGAQKTAEADAASRLVRRAPRVSISVCRLTCLVGQVCGSEGSIGRVGRRIDTRGSSARDVIRAGDPSDHVSRRSVAPPVGHKHRGGEVRASHSCSRLISRRNCAYDAAHCCYIALVRRLRSVHPSQGAQRARTTSANPARKGSC